MLVHEVLHGTQSVPTVAHESLVPAVVVLPKNLGHEAEVALDIRSDHAVDLRNHPDIPVALEVDLESHHHAVVAVVLPVPDLTSQRRNGSDQCSVILLAMERLKR